MKKLYTSVLMLLFFSIQFTAYGQHQLPNAGMENWDSSSNEPVGFHSFGSSTGSYAGTGKSDSYGDYLLKSTDVRPGSTGSTSAQILSRKIIVATANGNLTTGQIVAGSMTANDGTKNYNHSGPVYDGSQTFTGKPDSVVMWLKYTPKGSSEDIARVHTVIHSNADYRDPEDSNPTTYSQRRYASATLEYGPTNGWKRMSVPFTVTNPNLTPAYILMSFTTNRGAGKGSVGDAVNIDDVEFIYNSQLSSLKVGGNSVAGFNKNTYTYTYNVNSLDNLPAIDAAADGVGATVEKNISGGKAVITVKGNDYASNSANAHTYTINFVVNTAITAADLTATYGTAQKLNISSTSPAAFAYTIADPAIARIDGDNLIPLKAGSTTLTIKQAASGNYTEATKTVNITVNKATLTVAANDVSRAFGAANPDFTLSYKGFVNGDTEASLTEKPVAACVANATSKVGTYDITVSGGKADNYTFVYTTGKLTVTAAAAIITIDAIGEKTYGDADFSLKATSTNSVTGLTYSVADPSIAKITNGKVTILKAGKTTITVKQAASTNYGAAEASTPLVVKRAALTAKADNKSRVYGAADPVYTFTYSGFVNGDTEASLAKKPAAKSSATASSPVGNYNITTDNYADTNYDVTCTGATLTIEKAPLTATANITRRYGEENPALTITYIGLANGETASVIDSKPTATCSATKTSPAGTYDITVSGGSDNNYDITCKTGKLTVSKAILTVKADDAQRSYGEENPSFTFSYSGFVNGEDESVLTTRPTVSCTATATSAAGNYDITVSGGKADNYEFNYVKGTLRISASSAEITFPAIEEKQYGDEVFTLQASSNNTESLIVYTVEDASIARIDGNKVTLLKAGETTIKASQEATANFGAAEASTALVVKKAPLTVHTDAKSRVYGEENPALTLSFEGLVYNDKAADIAAPAPMCEASAVSKPAEYPITLDTFVDDRYEITIEQGVLTVEKATLTVTCRNESSASGSTPVDVFEIYITGFVNDETQEVIDVLPTASSEVTTSTIPGFYPIVIAGGEDDCYTFDYVEGIYTVRSALQAKTVITLNEITGKRYGDLPFAPVYNTNNSESALEFVFGNPEIVSYEGGRLHILKGGETTLKIRQAEGLNYSAGESNEITIVIEKAPLTVSVDNTSRSEGDENPTFTFSYNGLVNGDNAECIDTAPTATCTADATSEAGYYDITAAGGEDDCYIFTQYVSGTLLVKGKTIITLAEITDKRYGDDAFVPTVSSNNPAPIRLEIDNTDIARMENGKIVILRAGTTTLNAYQEESSLYSAGEASVTLAIEKAPLTVSVDNAMRYTGEANPEFTLTYSGFVNGDDASVIDATPVAECLGASLSSPAGYYEITVTGGEDDCYTFTQYIGGYLVVSEPVSGLNGPTLDGSQIFVADKRLVVKGTDSGIVEIYALNGRLAGRYMPGDIITLPAGFYIAKTAHGKACLQIK